MSRGLGSSQRVVVAALAASDEVLREGLSVAALRQLLPDDRSNRRRVINGLLRRGDVEIVAGGEDPSEARLKLTFEASLKALWELDPPGYGRKGDIEREIRAELRALAEAADELKAREAQKRRGFLMREKLWAEPGRALKRHRHPGEHQLRLIAVIAAYVEDPQMGLPRSAVQQIAAQGSGEAATRRALARLLERGTLQQTHDGGRVRITSWRLWWLHAHVSGMLDPPLDDTKDKAVLEAFGGSEGERVAGNPHGKWRDPEQAR